VSTVSTGALLPPAQLPGSKVAAGTYKLEPDHTQVLFTFNHLGFTDYTGQFVLPSGSLTIDPAHPHKSKVDVTFAIARVTTTSAHFDQALQSTEFFDAAKFPEAHFTSTKVVLNDSHATIDGDLTRALPGRLRCRSASSGLASTRGPQIKQRLALPRQPRSSAVISASAWACRSYRTGLTWLSLPLLKPNKSSCQFGSRAGYRKRIEG
jgi:hypothetical protein